MNLFLYASGGLARTTGPVNNSHFPDKPLASNQSTPLAIPNVDGAVHYDMQIKWT